MDKSEALEILVKKFTKSNKINFVEDERIKNKLFNEELCESMRDKKGRTELLYEEVNTSNDDDTISKQSTIYLPDITETAKKIGSNYLFLSFDAEYVYATPFRIISDIEKKQLLERVYKNPKGLLEPMYTLGLLEEGITPENYNIYLNDLEKFREEILELGIIHLDSDVFKSKTENGAIYAVIKNNGKKIYLKDALFSDENLSKIFFNPGYSMHSIILNRTENDKIYIAAEKNNFETTDYDSLLKLCGGKVPKKISIKTDFVYFNTQIKPETDEEAEIYIYQPERRDNLPEEMEIVKKGALGKSNVNFIKFALNLDAKKQNPEANKLILKYASEVINYKEFMVNAYFSNKKQFMEYFNALYLHEKKEIVETINELDSEKRDYEFDKFMYYDGFNVELKHDILYNEKNGLNAFRQYFKKSKDKELIIKDILSIKDETKKNNEIDSWLSLNYSEIINKVARLNVSNQENGKE